jgi:Cytochrome P450
MGTGIFIYRHFLVNRYFYFFYLCYVPVLIKFYCRRDTKPWLYPTTVCMATKQMQPSFVGMYGNWRSSGVQARDEEGQAMTDEELWEDVHDIMGAGHETTATTTAAAIHCICSRPEVESRVVQELDSVLGMMPSRVSMGWLQGQEEERSWLG